MLLALFSFVFLVIPVLSAGKNNKFDPAFHPDKKDCKTWFPANFSMQTFPERNCKGTAKNYDSMTYMQGIIGEESFSYKISRKLDPIEQLDFSAAGKLKNGKTWDCAMWVESAPKDAKPDECYNFRRNQVFHVPKCWRIIRWDMCTDERPSVQTIKAGIFT